MEPVHRLMVDAVACIEKVLALICGGPFSVVPSLSQNDAHFSIALVATVTAADEASMQQRGDDVAIERLADSIGVHSGIAEVSFQFE
jgi:hypothetical protein